MADFYDELLSYLKSKAAITSLVGSTSSSRIFPDDPKQGAALPFVILDEVGGDQPEILEGTGGPGIVRSVWHVYAMGATRTAANALSEVIRVNMQGYRGLMGLTYVNEVSLSTHRENGVDEPQDSSDAKRYWSRRIYDIWHEQPTS